MKSFSFKGRMIYFGLIAFISLGFFVLQLYSHLTTPSGAGSILLLILWGIMILFGLSGIFFSLRKRDRH